MPDVWSAVGALGAAGINAASTYYTNKDNKALAQLQNQWNIEQWERENAYNLPSQQMERLKAAGMNPNLVFANGDMQNTAAASPQMTSAAGMIRPYQIDPLTAAQIENLNAQTRKTDSETQTIDDSREEIVDQLRITNNKLAQDIEESKSRIEKYRKDNELTDAKINDLVSQAYKRTFDICQDVQRLANETGLAEAQIGVLQAEMKLKMSQKAVSDQQLKEAVETYSLRRMGLLLDNAESAARIKTAQRTFEKLGAEIEILEPDRLAAGNQVRRLEKFGNSNKKHGYVLGDFLQFIVENTSRELGHVLH